MTYLNKNQKLFYYIVGILFLISSVCATALIIMMTLQNKRLGDLFLPLFAALFVGVTVFCLLSLLSFAILYKNKNAGKIWVFFAYWGMKVLYPLLLTVAGFFKNGKDVVRGYFIEINNSIISYDNKKIMSNKILILLPHCLQNSDCPYKVAGNMDNCKRCGACKLGDLAETAEKYGVSLYVATGGTAARKVIKDLRPEAIISVACERDLSSGILDVRGIPVIGIINKRPNGPCFNTDVDIERVKEELERILSNG